MLSYKYISNLDRTKRTKTALRLPMKGVCIMDNKIKEWIKHVPADKRAEVLAKIQKCADKESILALAKEYKLPVTEEIAAVIVEVLKSPSIMSDDDLSLVAGGTISLPSDVCRPDPNADDSIC